MTSWFGLLGAEKRASRLYGQILRELGSTGVIIPIGDPDHENVARTVVTTVGGLVVPFTYSEAISSWDTPPTLLGPRQIPIVTFNGVDEQADSPDAAYWSRDDEGGANGFSIGLWGKVTDTAAYRIFIAKFATGQAEWTWEVDNSDILKCVLWDESLDKQPGRTTNAALTMGSLTLFVVTYDGRGGATAATGIAMYEDGAVVASSPINDVDYVGMEDGTSIVELGWRLGGNPFAGEMAGGPLGPFFVQVALTPTVIANIFAYGSKWLGL